MIQYLSCRYFKDHSIANNPKKFCLYAVRWLNWFQCVKSLNSHIAIPFICEKWDRKEKRRVYFVKKILKEFLANPKTKPQWAIYSEPTQERIGWLGYMKR